MADARESISVTLPAEQLAKLRDEADRRMLSTSLLVSKALAAFLPTLPPVPGDEPASRP